MDNFDKQEPQNQQQQRPKFKPYEQESIDEQPKKKDLFMYIVIGGVILIGILGIVFALSIKQKNEQSAKEAAKSQLSSLKIKQLPDSSNSDISRNQVSADRAKSNTKDAFNFGFKIISQVKALSGSAMDLTQLSDSDSKTLSKLFTTSQVLQDFNDIVNISSNGDDQLYGDAGTGIKKVKAVKVGSRYKIISSEFNINSDNSDEYVFDIKLKYKPQVKAAKQITKSLIVSVSKTTGKLTKVVQKV